MGRCPGCGAMMRRPLQYLCRSCWYHLPPMTRYRLRVNDDKQVARSRLFQLLSAIRRGVPLEDIELAA